MDARKFKRLLKKAIKEEKEKKVLCASCDKPIHIDDLGVVSNGKFYHKNFVCLVGMTLNFHK